MAGTIIFTGANSSLGIPAVEHILQNYPQHNAILTVRDASHADENTKSLRNVIARYPKANISVHELDLASLSATRVFADSVASGVQCGSYPSVVAIICNAYYWNLVGDPELTDDGYDKTFQVSHISHAALVLRLLRNCEKECRIILLSSDSHWPGKNQMERYAPTISDLDVLVNPPVDQDKQGRGYQRYATAKLAITTWMYPLNECLRKDPKLSNVTAVAINPGNLVDSRALRSNTPTSMARMQTFVYKPLLPLLRILMGPTLRTAAPAAVDVVELALNPAYKGQRGFYTLLEKDQSSPESRNREKQKRLWDKTLEWAKISKEDTVLFTAFD
ncbi:MAG: hypothetical protein M1820_009573 [Bogoriella megaspora]|nr:MAG: hypothetical protein M1820_009573 [Bogoriella megaspora]